MLSWEDGDPNILDKFNQTPVHVAARCNRASCLRLLLSKGGKLDVVDMDGKTPMCLATEQCTETIIQHQIRSAINQQISCILNRRRMEGNPQSRSARILEFAGSESSSEDENGSPLVVSDKDWVRSIQPLNNEDDESSEDDDGSAIVVGEKGECCKVEQNACSESVEVRTQSSVLVKREDIGQSSRECLVAYSASTDCCIAETKSGTSSNVIVETQRQVSTKVSSDQYPYEVIARGKKAIAAFKEALAKGTSSASRLKIIVVGNVRAGKTSLTRSLSGQPFVETREKTRGIQTTSIVESIVQNTELNNLWKVADCNESHVDALLARVVSDTLEKMLESRSRQVPELPPSPVDFKANQWTKPTAVSTTGLTTPFQSSSSSQVIVTEPCINVYGSPRKLPASLIAKNLLEKQNKNVSVKVNIWDFAGHRMYEPMHHVFMNSRSLYVVVFNLCKLFTSQQKALDVIHYWLNSIASHTTSSTPIILVGTHKAKVSNDFIEKAKTLCKDQFVPTFGNRLVRDFSSEVLFPVENSQCEPEDEGITDLRNVIKDEALMNFSFVNEELPLQWLHCEEEIIKYRQEAASKKCLSLGEVKVLLEQRCMVQFADDDFNAMMSFFHDSGLIILPDTMCASHEAPLIKELVVISPQYLVDAMTSIHDVPNNRNFQRQFSDELRELKSAGRIGSHVLEHVWKDKEVDAEILIQLLSCFNLLYPLHVEDEHGDVEAVKTGREYIIPCMLKDRPDDKFEERWRKAGESWQDDTERHFVFDFGRFLPPPLFDYLLIHIYRHSCCKKGAEPTIERRTAIFSISNKFLFRLKLVLKHCQIWVYCRCKKGENFLELAHLLHTKVFEICQQYFKYLKFVFGPPCPSESCPGAVFHGKSIQRPCESSSSESEGGSDSSDEAKPGIEDEPSPVAVNDRRRHVIPIKPNTFDPPYWCCEKDLSDWVKEWDPTTLDEVVNERSDDQEFTDDATFNEECVQECCLDLVSKKLGDNWKELGRKLHVKNAAIQNISADSSRQQEHGFQVLMEWKQHCGSEALLCKLVDALNMLPLKNVADELIKHYQEKHGEEEQP